MIKCLIYCTKSKDYHLDCEIVNGKKRWFCWNKKSHHYPFKYYKDEFGEELEETFNGHIVVQFDCEKVEEIFYNGWWECYANDKDDINCHIFDNELTCLTTNQIKEYLGDKKGYAIHISNLEIFYEPLDLEKGGIYKENGYRTKMVTKAPQNMQYVNDIFGRECVLISIKPEWVCKILNGEKTIEVRKSIVNKLKELI